MFIGKRVQDLRKAKKMTLSELAQKSEVQIATLSRIENLKMIGTLDSHMAVAKALGVNLVQLYQDLDSPTLQTMEEKPADTFTYNQQAAYEILTNRVLTKKMMPVILKIDAGGQTNPEQNLHGSEKFVFVLEGKVTITVGDQQFPLATHQTLYFNASMKHFFTNNGKKTTRLLAVTTPVAL